MRQTTRDDQVKKYNFDEHGDWEIRDDSGLGCEDEVVDNMLVNTTNGKQEHWYVFRIMCAIFQWEEVGWT